MLGAAVVCFGGIACGDSGDPSEPQPEPDPVVPAFPADYQSTYTMVRDCRETSDHGLGATVQVWVDPESAQNYLVGESFEEGSVLVKPIYSGDDCDIGALSGYVAMIKGPAGTDPGHNDWIWQELDADRNVTRNGLLASCSGCHANCIDRDYACTEE